MKNVVLAVATALVLAGTSFIATGPAAARDRYHHHMRPHHRARICTPVYRNKVVWRNHHRHVVRVRVGQRCHWR